MITVIPAATRGTATIDAYEAIRTAKKIFVQTKKHPSIEWVCELRPDAVSMDDLYDECFDFDELNRAIADRLVSSGDDAAYVALGRGAGEAVTEAIRNAADENGETIRSLASGGFAEAAMQCIGMTMPDNVVICKANALENAAIDTHRGCIIEELDTRIMAGETKLLLSEYFPDEHETILFTMDSKGEYGAKRIKLYELDRQDCFDAATVLYIPKAEFMELTRHGVDSLMHVLKRLRAPGGCPWDAEQTHESLRTPLIEEAYEVLDTIDSGDADAMCEELGDLLLQIAFHAQIEEEHSSFTMRDVCTGIVNKLIFRHPHVFGSVNVSGTDEVLSNWENLKKIEKHQKTQAEVIRAIPKSFPALTRSFKVQKKAADVGFDWSNAKEAFFKIGEETRELEQAMSDGTNTYEELGDLLFSVVNVARLLKIDPELCLNDAATKFADRFIAMEALAEADGRKLCDMTLNDMDVYWNKAKGAEKR